MQTFVLEINAHNSQCIVRAQFQQEPQLVFNYVSIITWTNHNLLLNPTIVLNVCIKGSQKNCGFVSFNPCRMSLNFSTNSRNIALEFGLYTCIENKERFNNFNLNMHTLFHRGNNSSHQHNLPTESL